MCRYVNGQEGLAIVEPKEPEALNEERERSVEPTPHKRGLH